MFWYLLTFLLGALCGGLALLYTTLRSLSRATNKVEARRDLLSKANSAFLSRPASFRASSPSDVLATQLAPVFASSPNLLSSASPLPSSNVLSSLNATQVSSSSLLTTSEASVITPSDVDNSVTTSASATTSVLMLDATKAEMQLGGKVSSRARVFCSLRGTTLWFGPSQDQMTSSISLRGCEVRRAPPQVGLANALEILNPSNKLYDKYDYIFLSFTSRRMETLWYDALARWCVVPVAEHAHTVPRDNPTESNLIRYKGWLCLQFNESETILTRFCILEDFVLTHFDSDNLSKTKHASRIHLSDVPVLEVSKMKFKATPMSRPLDCTYDYCYFTMKKADDYVGWKAAFDAHNLRVYESHTDTAAQESVIVKDASLLAGGLREPAKWLNAILKRFVQNARVSERILNKIRERMTKKLQEKIEDKNLQSSVEDLKVTNLYIPTHFPEIMWAQLLPSAQAEKIVCDMLINWNSEMDPATFTITATVVINWPKPRFKSFDVDMSFTITRMFGKMHLECDPFPASRFSICFYEEPHFDFAVKSGFTALPDAIRFKLEEFIVKKVKISLLQKFLMPNRKYFKIPVGIKTPDEPAKDDEEIEAFGKSSSLLNFRKPLSAPQSEEM